LLGDAWGSYASNTNANLFLNQSFIDSSSGSYQGPGGLDLSNNLISSINAGASSQSVYIVPGYSDPTYGQRTIGVYDAASNGSIKQLSWGVGGLGTAIYTYLTGSTTINVNSSSTLQFWLGGQVLEESGTTGSITKVGNGQLRLEPYAGSITEQNSYSGGFTLSGGTVILGDNDYTNGSYIPYQPLGTGTFTIGGGTVSVDVATGKQAKLISNPTNVSGNFTFLNSSGVSATFSGSFDLQGGTRTVTVSSTSASTGNLVLTGAMSNGSLIKAGTGTLRLVAGSTKTLGGLSVTAGVLELSGAGVVSGSPLTTVGASGTLSITTDSSTGTVSLGGLTGSGLVQIPSSLMTLSLNPAADTSFSGTITGSGALIKTGSFKEQLVRGGAKSVASILVNGGTLELAGAGVISGTTPVSVTASGSLAITTDSLAGTVTIGALNGAGSVNVATNMTLSISPATSATFSDGISGGGLIAKDGSGTQTFSGTVGNTGGLSVNGGLLTVSGTISSSFTGATTVSSSGAATLDLKTAYPSTAGSITFSGSTTNTVAFAGSTIISEVAQPWGARNITVPTGSTLYLNVPNTVATGTGTGNVVPLTVASLTVGTASAAGTGYVLLSQSMVNGSGARVYAPMVVVTSGLTIPLNGSAYTGFVDLNNNDMIIHGGSESAVDAMVKAWWNGGTPLRGNSALGLGSSLAQTGTSPNTSTQTSLGVITNSDGAGGTLYPTFDGVTSNSTDVLVKYTYLGDTNLDGVVDSNDLSNFFGGYYGGLTGWLNGDFNYDGVVNSADYSLMLAGLGFYGMYSYPMFSTTGPNDGPFEGAPTWNEITAKDFNIDNYPDFARALGVAIPEPGGAGLAFAAAVPLLARRSPRRS
jgi:hypothetical protein